MSATQIKKLSLAHEAIIDWFLCNPLATLEEASRELKYSIPWLNILKNSDQFKAEINRRRGFIEEDIEQDILAHLRGAAITGIKRTVQVMSTSTDLEQVTNATEMFLKKIGYGEAPQPAQQNNPSQTIVFNGPVSPELLAKARSQFGKSPLEARLEKEQENDLLPAAEVRVIESSKECEEDSESAPKIDEEILRSNGSGIEV